MVDNGFGSPFHRATSRQHMDGVEQKKGCTRARAGMLRQIQALTQGRQPGGWRILPHIVHHIGGFFLRKERDATLGLASLDSYIDRFMKE